MNESSDIVEDIVPKRVDKSSRSSKERRKRGDRGESYKKGDMSYPGSRGES